MVWLKSGSWYLRFYTDVNGARKQVARFLVRKDEKHHSKTCKPVKDLAASMIAKENSAAILDTEKAQTLTEFWEATYEPYIKDSKRLSTQASYADLWTRHVEPVLGTAELPTIRTRDISLLLTDMAKGGHGRNSIAHVRSLISGILTHAVNLGLLESNPVRDCKVLAAVKQSKPTEFYTEQEVEAILKDLDDMPNCQAVCAVLFYCGLRPSEAAWRGPADIRAETGGGRAARFQVHAGAGPCLRAGEAVASVLGADQRNGLIGATLAKKLDPFRGCSSRARRFPCGRLLDRPAGMPVTKRPRLAGGFRRWPSGNAATCANSEGLSFLRGWHLAPIRRVNECSRLLSTFISSWPFTREETPQLEEFEIHLCFCGVASGENRQSNRTEWRPSIVLPDVSGLEQTRLIAA
jgi:hypothetical protein